MIQASEELKADGKHIILMYEKMREHNTFHMRHILPILRLEPWSIFNQNLVI